MLLEPLTATLLAGLFLSERLSAMQWCGAGLVLLTVLQQSLAIGREAGTAQ